MDDKPSRKSNISRRGLIRLAGLTAGSVGGIAAGLEAQPIEAAETASAEVSAGYHESEHVKTYYARARM